MSAYPKSENHNSGWPWSRSVDPSIYASLKTLPKISIVTPSYNQAEYLEETIRSILLQNYPNLELIIIDGGSTDGTLDILKKYEPWITYWVSEPDRNQSHAINKGFDVATGDLVGWQNSDDIYLEGAFYEVVKKINKVKSDIYYGHIHVIDEKSRVFWGFFFAPFSVKALVYYGMNFANQSMFFPLKAVKSFKISEEHHYAMDRDFIFQLATNGYKFQLINKPLGCFRMHEVAKTVTAGWKGKAEWEGSYLKGGYDIKKKGWSYHSLRFIYRLRKYSFLLINGNIVEYIKIRLVNLFTISRRP